jgi:hypothetical protein
MCQTRKKLTGPNVPFLEAKVRWAEKKYWTKEFILSEMKRGGP